ncbi:MAG: NAD(P)H:quinone oxidoreductase [Tomitella sp.]|nr:NAD(P)H:quinone oxidoreductase [Tomitella sp.]
MARARIAVIYYSATGNMHRLAQAFAEGASDAGAQVRLRRVPELAPAEVVGAQPAWREHLAATEHIDLASLEDLDWADGIAFGTPTRFGNVSSQLKQFLDTTSGLWVSGRLATKAVTGFTGSMDPHGGQESTLLALFNTKYPWGSVIVPPCWVDYEVAHAAGGNPYGISQVETQAIEDPAYAKAVREAARNHGARLTRIAQAVSPLRTGLAKTTTR